jgi:hypothetical protein
MKLYKNGTVYYYKRYILDLRCEFDFSNLPKDKHYCDFVFYPINYDKSQVQLTVGNTNNLADQIILQTSVSSEFEILGISTIDYRGKVV